MKSIWCSFLVTTGLVLLKNGPSMAAETCNTALWESGEIKPAMLKASSNAAGKTVQHANPKQDGSGWCPHENTPSWIEVNFGRDISLRAIKISGDAESRLTSYYVKYVPAKGEDLIYYGSNGAKSVFTASKTEGSNIVYLMTSITPAIVTSKIRIEVKEFHIAPCFKFELYGCDSPDALCSVGCGHNGVCDMEEHCQCPPTLSGPSCRTEYKPKGACGNPIGFSSGKIANDHISVSSYAANHGKEKLRPTCCLGEDRGAWCPATSDKSPWVEIRFDKPTAIEHIGFFHPSTPAMSVLPDTYMKSFALYYKPSLSRTHELQLYSKGVPSIYNSTTHYTISLIPKIVTDGIRIVPEQFEKHPCFRLELYGCEPQGLCPQHFCENSGTCAGDNYCSCKNGYYGNRCHLQKNAILTTAYSFLSIQHNTLHTTHGDFTTHGHVTFETGTDHTFIKLNGLGSYIQIPQTQSDCVSNPDKCPSGFTISLIVHLYQIQGPVCILSSGAEGGFKGTSLLIQNNQIHLSVKNEKWVWNLVTKNVFAIGHWYTVQIAWNPVLGLTLTSNGNVVGYAGKPEQNPASVTQIHETQIGSAVTHATFANLAIKGLQTWNVNKEDLENAGLITTTDAPSTTEKPTTVTMPAQVTTDGSIHGNFNFSFTGMHGGCITTPSSLITPHNGASLVNEHQEHVLVFDNPNQYATLENNNTCLQKPEKCSNGFTLQFHLMFLKIDDAHKMYVISTGSSSTSTAGVDLLYQHGKFVVVVKSPTSNSMAPIKFVAEVNVWYKFEISWKPTAGPTVVIDGITYPSFATPQHSFGSLTHGVLFIGKSPKESITTQMKIKEIFLWNHPRDWLVIQHILPATMLPTTTTVSTTPKPTVTKGSYETFEWNFTNPTSSHISGNHFEVTAIGSPTFTKGGIDLHATNQYLDFGVHKNDCLGNLELCTKGITMSFTLTFKGLEENTVIFSNGAEKPGAPGFTILYRFGQIQFVFSTTLTAWYVSVPRDIVTLNQQHAIVASWEKTIGLKVYIDGKLIGTAGKPIPHPQALIHEAHLYFGKTGVTGSTTYHSVNCIVHSCKIWTIHIEIIIDIVIPCGSCSCPTCPPGVTTSKPNKTTKPDKTTKPSSGSHETTSKKPKPSKPTKPTSSGSHETTSKKPKPSKPTKPGSGSHETTSKKPKPSKPTKPGSGSHETTSKKPKPSKPTKPGSGSHETTTRRTRPTRTMWPPTSPGQCPAGCVSIDDLTTRPKPTVPPTTTKKPDRPPPCQCKKAHITANVNGNGLGYFTCQFPRATVNNVEFLVFWYLESKRILTQTVSGREDKATITAAQINDNIWNKKIQCEVKARYVDSIMTSKSCFGEFQVNVKLDCRQKITMVEGGPSVPLNIHTNVPPSFLCQKGERGRCTVHFVTTFVPQRHEWKCSRDKIIPQAVLGWLGNANSKDKFCGTHMTNSNWGQTISIPVKATIDGLYDRNQIRNIKVEAITTGQISVTHDLGLCQVNAIDNDHRALCASVNDPHMATFDGTRYDNFLSGEFVLYRHKSNLYEVRTRYEKCSRRSHATCNVAVAIRSGDDVIVFSRRRQSSNGLFSSLLNHFRKPPIVVQIYKNGEMTLGTKILRKGCGQHYEVHLPSGAQVNVQTSYRDFINVWVKASSIDFKQTEGLCGYYDRDRHNDLTDKNGHIHRPQKHPDQFSASWKETSSIFHGVPPMKFPQPAVYCSCFDKYQQYCAPGLDVFRCDTHASREDITRVLVGQAKAPVLVHRGKRDVYQEEIFDEDEADDPKTTYTNDTARDFCENYIKNKQSVKNCESILNETDFSDNIDNCVTDLMIDSNPEWAEAHLKDILRQCLTEAKSNVELWNTGENETDAQNPEKIVGDLCGDCGSHGKCVEDDCVCEEGYSGFTCNISKQTKPSVITVTENSLCDEHTSDCKNVPISGENFVDSPSLKCRYQYIKVTNKTENTKQTGEVPAQFISINQVNCPLPESRSSRIMISNDADVDAEETFTHIVFDTRCYICVADIDGNTDFYCNQRKDTCVIGRQCYQGGEKNAYNPHQTCDPSINNWVTQTDGQCAQKGDKVEKCAQTGDNSNDDDILGKEGTIALSVCCGILALICLSLIVHVCRQRSRKPSEFGDYDVAEINPHRTNRELKMTDEVANYDNPAYKGT